MIAELGHYALVLALGMALVQGTLPFIGAARRDPVLTGVAEPSACAQFLFVTVAFAALMHGYVTSDFSIDNVAENSHSAKPLIYKISGTWGNHEGSLVLWVWILSLFGAAVALLGRNLPPSFRARVLGVQALIGLGFLAFLLFTSNPFLRLDPPPLDGRGLNPILQDPGLAFHPPMLYLGYVGLSTAYSFAAPGIQARYPDKNAFFEMVKKSYQPVYHPGNYAFGRSRSIAAGATIYHEVLISGRDGRDWTAIYQMTRQPDSGYKINGVQIMPNAESKGI